MTTPPSWLNAAYTILVNVCGAFPGERGDFIHAQSEPSDNYPREWRFRGYLGFGGKFWRNDSVYVNCYREDETPARLAIIAEANRQLAALTKDKSL